MSPLHFLFWKSGPMGENRLREAARFLVNCGCPIDLRENSGESPLHVACLRKERLFNNDFEQQKTLQIFQIVLILFLIEDHFWPE